MNSSQVKFISSHMTCLYLSAFVRSEKRLSATVAELTGARFCSRKGVHVESSSHVDFHCHLSSLADLHYLSTAPSFNSYHAQNDCLQAQQGHGPDGSGSDWNCQCRFGRRLKVHVARRCTLLHIVAHVV